MEWSTWNVDTQQMERTNNYGTDNWNGMHVGMECRNIEMECRQVGMEWSTTLKVPMRASAMSFLALSTFISTTLSNTASGISLKL